ncbi:glycosyltransferase family 87 protein [Spongiactinospora sp. TRM90649]|uniref:glycosyltransferase family 87 protein n=1 Tax=Spongiactinospora sp. TRM90649 TaxID=3031114 RepID=UPI0023F62284|nr:glycosyltransferase family 87 protein [Spongiactinospora sp. TRM90649]MDF5753003.1 glycosyltransferase family 87 protein [Spongiactinospora sp. TRM90649]
MKTGEVPTVEPTAAKAVRRWRSWLPAAAFAVLVVVAAAAPLVGYWLFNADDQRLVDLDVYRTGGQAVLDGRPVYDFITPAPQLLPFTYPPVAALLAVPLAWMSWVEAQWVWTAGVFLALALAVRYAFRPLLERTGQSRDWAAPLLFAVLMVACTYLMPIRDQVRFGQVDILLVALCLADCLARRPWWPRGLLIGIATAVKLTPGVFLIYLLVTSWGRDHDKGQRQALYVAVLTAGLLSVLPFLVIPQDAAQFWFSALLDNGRVGANTATTNQSMRGMLLRLYWPEPLSTLLWAALVAVVGWYGFRRAKEAYAAGDTPTAVALAALMAVLLSPVAWIHHLAWVVVVLGALVGAGRDRVRLLVAAGVWLYYVVPIPWYGVTIRAAEIPVVSPVIGRIVQNAFGLGALGLVWLLGSWLPRRRERGRAGP